MSAAGRAFRVGAARAVLRDAPSDYIGVAEVAISEVSVVEADDGERFVLLDASADPRVFDSMSLRDGLEAFLAQSPVAEGEGILVSVDFDVDESLIIQGNPETPAGIKGVLFTPVLKEKRRDAQELS